MGLALARQHINTLVPAPATPVAQAPPVVENILNVNAPVVINGMQPVEHVRLTAQYVQSALCIIVTTLAPAVKSAAKLCSAWLSTLTVPPAAVGFSSKVSGKTLLGVVIYSNGASGGGWIMTVKPVKKGIAWDTGSNYSTGITDKAVSASCTNTQKLVAKGSRFAAATAANNYKPTGTPSGKSWCLPSYDLLNNLNNSTNLAKVNTGITTAGGKKIGFGTSYSYEIVWSSSEYSDDVAWEFYATTSGSFRMGSNIKSNLNYGDSSVRPVMEF